jgi:glycosyltransferase involved in cell wall biosynthesis
MKVDVVLLTKNSLKPCLPECLSSIYKYIPVNRLIVVDGGSVDGTLELLQHYPRVEIIEDPKGTRATARQKGIEAVETEWHAHVDSDVILCSDWFQKASKFACGNVGAVWGVAIPIEPHTFNIMRAMSRFYRMPIRDMLAKQVRSERCMMHDTLIRTEAVEGIRIPRELHIWEDEYIGRFITQRGWRFLKVKEPYCLHHISPNVSDKAILNGYLLRKYRIWSFKKVVMRFALAIPKASWIYVVTGDLEAAKMQVLSYVLTMKGWLL